MHIVLQWGVMASSGEAAGEHSALWNIALARVGNGIALQYRVMASSGEWEGEHCRQRHDLTLTSNSSLNGKTFAVLTRANNHHQTLTILSNNHIKSLGEPSDLDSVHF